MNDTAFCSVFWDLNYTWYTPYPDFTSCFHQTVLVWPPCILFIVVGPFRWLYLCNKTTKFSKRQCTSVKLTRTVLNVLAVLASMTEFLLTLTTYIYKGEIVITVDLLTWVLIFFAMLSTMLLISIEYRKSVQSADCTGVIWIFLLIGFTLKFQSDIRAFFKKDDDRNYIGVICSSIICLEVLLETILALFVGKDKARPNNLYPENSSSIVSQLGVLWFTSLIVKGHKKCLEFGDLWNLTREHTSQHIWSTFEKHWEPITESDKRNKQTQKLLPCLFKVYWKFILLSGVYRFIHDMQRFIGPVLLMYLIEFIESQTPYTWHGYFFCCLLFLQTMTNVICNGLLKKYTGYGEIHMQTAVTMAIYKKIFRLSQEVKKKLIIGDVINMVAVDSQAFKLFMEKFHSTWIVPVQFFVMFYYFWNIIGVSIVPALLLLCTLIPVSVIILRHMKAVQVQHMKIKDKRLQLTTTAINGIKVLKLNAWEQPFKEDIVKTRKEEMKMLKKLAKLRTANRIIETTAPFVMAFLTFATFVLLDENNKLDASVAFVTLSLFNMLRTPLQEAIEFLSRYTQFIVSIKRIQSFLELKEFEIGNKSKVNSQDEVISIYNGTFTWDNVDEPTLKKVPQGSLIAVVGRVGSGKSSLLSAIAGEMKRTDGAIEVDGSFAYMTQRPWIQATNVKENITFGKLIISQRYDDVIQACELSHDIAMFPDGHLSEIGEGGINLSGGQKQRISLARLVYMNADIYLLDDPLSAVDPHTARKIFQNVIGSDGLLRHKTRIIVTNDKNSISEADMIVTLENGTIHAVDYFKTLNGYSGALNGILKDSGKSKTIAGHQTMERRDSAVLGQMASSSDLLLAMQCCGLGSLIELNHLKKLNKTRKVIANENLKTGMIKTKVIGKLARSIGPLFHAIVSISFLVHFTAYIYSGIWLSEWTADYSKNSFPVDRSQLYMRLSVYGVLCLIQVVTLIFATLFLFIGILTGTSTLHGSMLNSILHSPMGFFIKNPSGRILNRFSKDIYTMDNMMTDTIYKFLYHILRIMFTISLIIYVTPPFAVVLIPVPVLFILAQRYYVVTSRQLQRLESASLSPVYSHFKESIEGALIIRSLGQQCRFIKELHEKMDASIKVKFHNIVCNRWLTVQLNFLGAIIVLASAVSAVALRDTLSAGLLGLSVSTILSVSKSFSRLGQVASRLESAIVSVERVVEYHDIPNETDLASNDKQLTKSWPKRGEIKFRNYSTRYEPGLDTVLSDITLDILPGEKIGIVGRSGAGKTSLVLSLFRILDTSSGYICIDDLDTSKIGIRDLRRKMSIISQEPILFSGSLRKNLDPHFVYTDDEIWKALERVNLKSYVAQLQEGLHHDKEENFSVGQKQLICLARALLRNTRIIVLDEATASVDSETDRMIQRTIRDAFGNCTVLTVAHRIDTVIDSDRIMVVEDGKIKEFDSPNNLLMNENGIFFDLVKQYGLLKDVEITRL